MLINANKNTNINIYDAKTSRMIVIVAIHGVLEIPLGSGFIADVPHSEKLRVNLRLKPLKLNFTSNPFEVSLNSVKI
jgi:hypothetical protein